MPELKAITPKSKHVSLFLLLMLSVAASADETSKPKPAPETCQFDYTQDTWICSHLSEQTETSSTLDWIDNAFLNSESRAALGAGCSGAYFDPLANSIEQEQDISMLPLIIEADSTEVIEGNTATLRGQVRVSQGPRSIGAEEMSYDRLNDSATLQNDVTIRQPNLLIRGEQAKMSTVEQQASFTNASFVIHDLHMRGSAESIEQDGQHKLRLRGGVITSCEPGSKAWSLEGQELSIDQQSGQGYGKNVKLKLGGVPVFYLPYISFPVGDERRSGVLFPSISSSDDGGLDIALPYYLNLAPNYDATVTPRLITGRGSMLETEFRHLNSRFLSTFSAAILPNDKGGQDADVDELIRNNEAKESDLRPYKGSNRWLIQLEQIGGLRMGWYSNIDYTKVSDENYFRDLGTSSFSVANTTYLNQSFDLGAAYEHWNIALRVQDYQTLLLDLDSPYRKLPQITAKGLYSLGASTNLLLKNEATRFDHNDKITGERISIDYRVNSQMGTDAIFIKPELGYQHRYYQLQSHSDDPLAASTISLGAPQFSLDLGLVLENSGGRFMQTLEPRAYYLYRQYQNHDALYSNTGINFDTSSRAFSYGQLYRDSRFSGSDRLDDANQATIGITNRWYSHEDGHELFNVSVGQINHFRDRRIGLEREITDTENASEIVFDFSAYWRNGSGLYGSLIYDDAAEQMNRFSAGYHYASSDQLTQYNVGYSFLRVNPEEKKSEQLDQVDAAFVTPVTRQWYVMGRSNYDFENKQELESFIGFEYNDCCYRVRLLARRWLDSNIAKFSSDDDAIFDQGLFFEIHLKGLGGSGAKVNSILEDAIPGYKRREQALNKH